MFYLAQIAPQFPVAEITYPDNSGSKNLIDPNQIKEQYVSGDKGATGSITLSTMGDYELNHGGGRALWISPKRLVYDIEIPFNSPMSLFRATLAKGVMFNVVDAETGDFFGGGYSYNPEDVISVSFPFPVPPSAQQNPQSVPEPSVLLAMTSVGMVALLRKRNKRN